MTVNGSLYALPMPDLATIGLEFSSSQIAPSALFRTPAADEAAGGVVGESLARERNHQVRLSDQIRDLSEMRLLPTPNTMDSLPPRSPEKIAESKERQPAGYSNLREYVINNLEPAAEATTIERSDSLQLNIPLIGTPRASASPGTQKQIDAGAPKSRIEDQVLATNWGRFEPAIKRWERVIGRVAPEPTRNDGRDGAPRLNPAFAEWMMGIPAGWVTDVEISRADQLRALGNGVVPQQAMLALQLLGISEMLEGIDGNDDQRTEQRS
jgi:hypothetical protein